MIVYFITCCFYFYNNKQTSLSSRQFVPFYQIIQQLLLKDQYSVMKIDDRKSNFTHRRRLHNQSPMPCTALFMSVTFEWRKLLKTILSLRNVYHSIAYCFYCDLTLGVVARCLLSPTWRKIKVHLPACVQKYFNRIQYLSRVKLFWFLLFSFTKRLGVSLTI